MISKSSLSGNNRRPDEWLIDNDLAVESFGGFGAN